MPLKLNVGGSKKIGEANYGSRGASVNLELELDSTLVQEPAKLQDKIRQMFALVRESLAEELNGKDHAHDGRQSQPAATNGNGTKGGNPRPATQSQVKALHAIAKAQRLNISQVLRERFQVSKPEDLTIKQASLLIDSLNKSRQQGG